MSGFLFGFDTIVISNAQHSIQNFWSLNGFENGFTISIALTGAVTGFLSRAVAPAKTWRKKTYILLVSSPGTSAVGGNTFLQCDDLPSINFCVETNARNKGKIIGTN